MRYLVILTLLTTTAFAAERYKKESGSHEVAVIALEWQDTSRKRSIPAKIYFPKSIGPVPVVIFSHGLGGTRDGYEYLGRYWASHGYASVHLQHVGSDDSVWRGSKTPLADMKKAVTNVSHAINRPLDVRFAIDQLEKANIAGELKGRLDLNKIGIAGHSFGSYTVLAASGMTFAAANDRNLGDKRIKAAIPMSSPVPRNKETLPKTYGSITIPSLHMTGTKDDSPVSDTTAQERRLPFDHSTNAERYLIIFQGGDHMIFSGRPRGMGDGSKDARFQELIRQSTLAFWDAYLNDDPKAKAWLMGSGLKETLGADATLEFKKAGQR